MYFISHRGNISKIERENENKPKYIENALSLGFDVEVDVRFENGEFQLKDIKAKFGWSNLQTNESFIKSIKEVIRYTRNELLTQMFKTKTGFKSFKNVIDESIKINKYNNLTSAIMVFYSRNSDNFPIVFDEPYKFINDDNEEIEIYVDEYLRINENEIFEKANLFNLFSSWHYTGTCSDISNRDTGELLPGCMIADGSAFNGPVKNNSMASIAAIGYYMAEMAINQKEEKLCKCKPDVMYSEMY